MPDRKTILLVDDSANDLFLMRAAFEDADFPAGLNEVHNGEEAIAYLSGKGAYRDRHAHPLPTVVLLDLNMPRKNGFDVLTWARTQPDIRHIPIIILTSSLRPEDVARAYDLGANGFLVKPTGLHELVAMIATLRDWLAINHFPPGTGMLRNS